MASADQLKALIRSHASRDDERFYSVALQVAAQEARSGHGRIAQELRELVDEAKQRAERPVGQHTRPVPVVQPRGELAGLLAASYPDIRLADMTLAPDVRARLDRVLLEQVERVRIRGHGFSPIRKLLLVGPPGTGKTMTAAALAGELGLPLFAVRLDGLITKYLGETAAKLRLVFDAVESTRAVYLFDEFDALGGERAARNEVGEIRRVLNSFLQFLERDESDSLIVCATNHPALLDSALFRRFESLIEYAVPSSELAEQVIRNRLASLDVAEVEWSGVRDAATGLSHADLARACEVAAKHAILEHRTRIDTGALVAALRDRSPLRR